MTRVTHREYLVRLAWLDREWNEPSRTDHYLMQIAKYLDAIWRKLTKLGELDSYKIPFGRKTVRDPKTEGERRAQQSRTMWGAVMKSNSKGPRRGN